MQSFVRGKIQDFVTTGKTLGILKKTKIDELVDILKDIYGRFTPSMYNSTLVPIIIFLKDIDNIKKIFLVI